MIRVLVALLALWLSSCLAPPAMLPVRSPNAEFAITLYPDSTEKIEIALEDGVVLRGLHIPVDEEDAPLVLHLLESSGSATSIDLHYGVLCDELAQMGFASLLVDYTGVGASDGEPSVRNLARDVRAMWREAVQRAGGEQRVVVRATSLGTLGAAHLMEEGARPAGVLLLAPIRAETAVERFASEAHSSLVGSLSTLIYDDITDVDVIETVAGSTVPLIAASGVDDIFLSARERENYRKAVEAAGGSWIDWPQGHTFSSVLAHEVFGFEIEFLAELFPNHPDGDVRLAAGLARLDPEVAIRFEDPAVRGRLRWLMRHVSSSDARIAAAVAIANPADRDAVSFAWHLARVRGPLRKIDFEDLVEVASLEIEGYRVPWPRLYAVGIGRRMGSDYGFGGPYPGVKCAAAMALIGHKEPLQLVSGVELGWDRIAFEIDMQEILAELRAGGVAEERLVSAATRLLLKAVNAPARAARDDGGEGVVEVFRDGRWRPVDFTQITEANLNTSSSGVLRPGLVSFLVWGSFVRGSDANSVP